MLRCSETDLGTETSTPLLYPDGEARSVFGFEKGGVAIIHDGGMAAYNLAKSGQSYTKSIAVDSSAFAGMYGCEIRGHIVYRSCDISKVSEDIYTVASACSFTGPLLPLDEKATADSEAEVLATLGRDFPTDHLNLKPKHIGETGKVYDATAAIIDKIMGDDLVLIKAVSNSRSVNSKFRAFYDIRDNPLYKSVDRISVFDAQEVFPEGDMPRLQDVSNLVPIAAFETKILQYARKKTGRTVQRSRQRRRR
jgi:hypothetical protein